MLKLDISVFCDSLLGSFARILCVLFKMKYMSMSPEWNEPAIPPPPITHLELRGLFELIEFAFRCNCLFQALEENSLELYNFLDIAEERVDLCVAEECFFLHGLQVVLQQAV